MHLYQQTKTQHQRLIFFVIFFYLTDVQVVAGYHADDMPSTGKLLQIVDQAIIIVAPDNLDLAIAY